MRHIRLKIDLVIEGTGEPGDPTPYIHPDAIVDDLTETVKVFMKDFTRILPDGSVSIGRARVPKPRTFAEAMRRQYSK